MDWILDPQIWIALLTLTTLEIVLGIDNLVFISILADKLPEEERDRASHIGLLLAMGTRLLLLFSIAWIFSLTEPLFTVFGTGISVHDLILIVGGMFLIGKSTFEIHDKLEGEEGHAEADLKQVTFASVLTQIVILDVVFSIDSVITAVGMVDQVPVMVAAIVIAVGIMLLAVDTVADFVNEHPTIKMLALSFLLLIGFSLVVEGLHQHIPKGYIYFAMGFSVLVEFLNLRLKASKPSPVQLRKRYSKEKDSA